MNNVKLTSSLWIYAIHSRNAELIHLLEENGIESEDKTFEECLKESIKCHHNDIANYIKENCLDEKILQLFSIGRSKCFIFINKN